MGLAERVFKKVSMPIKIGHVEPNRRQISSSKKGPSLEFTNGCDMEFVSPDVLRLASMYGYLPTETTCLALHGKGSVLPHTDGLIGNGTLVWLVSDNTSHYKSCLMVAKGNEKGVMEMEPGDVVLFNAEIFHAWVSNSAWSMFVVDVSTRKKDQHRDFISLRR